MHVVTHLLAGWALAQEVKLKGRERALVTWSCVVADVDGAGMLIDAANRVLARGETYYYEQFHHVLGHGLPAEILWTAAAWALGARKALTLVWIVLAFHLHLLMDLAGSRGSAPTDIWPIPYLAPISSAMTFSWNGQWPLTSWQNTSLTVVLMVWALIQALRLGASPVSLFSQRADRVFVETLRRRWGQWSGRLGS